MYMADSAARFDLPSRSHSPEDISPWYARLRLRGSSLANRVLVTSNHGGTSASWCSHGVAASSETAYGSSPSGRLMSADGDSNTRCSLKLNHPPISYSPSSVGRVLLSRTI